MNPEKKKISIPLIVVGSLVSAAIGYYINGAYHKGIEVKEFVENIEVELSYPFRDYFDHTTIKAVIYSLIAFTIVMLMYYTSRRNLMPGKEYGTARFAQVKEINKALKATSPTGEMGNHRILSQNVRMNIKNKLTNYNNNILVIGGSGGGKTFRFVKPNLMQLNTSFIVTDPKGEILRSMGAFLENNGYRVKVLNLIDMTKSDGYNPFDYIVEENDIPILIHNIIGNTTPKNANPSDPFWQNAEEMFLMSLFFYVWLEKPKKHRNLRSVMQLLRLVEVKGKDEPSELDKLMSDLAMTSPKRMDHPAVMYYKMSMTGAADTVRSIIISANARLAKLQSETVLRLFDRDEMHFDELGIGASGDEQTKTALFCLIPDNDKTYNFIVGMLYTQAFQTLYRIADEEYQGELPIHVTFMMDEFANVALPDDFCSLISTMRSRSISSIVIIQNLAQIKAMFKDTWETITGNCDTTIYLGGNEQSTHKYMSELLGKMTIEKRATGETRGRQGSSSKNFDVMQRDLMTPDEVSRLPRNKCIIKISGQYPIIDDKFNTLKHRKFKESGDGDGEIYVLTKQVRADKEKGFEILGPKSLAYYERKSKTEHGSGIHIETITLDELMILDELSLHDWFDDMDDISEVTRVNESMGMNQTIRHPMPDTDEDDSTNRVKGLIRASKGKPYDHPGVAESAFIREPDIDTSMASESLKERLDGGQFTPEQLEEILLAVKAGLPEEYILSYAYPEKNTMQLASYRAKYNCGLKTA